MLRERSRNPKPEPQKHRAASGVGWQLGREGEQERERKREKGRTRHSRAGLKVAAHVRMAAWLALSSASSSGKESQGIASRGVCRTQESTDVWGHCFQAQHNVPPLHKRFHGSAHTGCCTICQCCCPLFPLFHTPLEEKSQYSSYPQPQQIIQQGNYFFPQDTCYAVSQGLWRTHLAAGRIQTPARPCAICPPAQVEGKGQGKKRKRGDDPELLSSG